MKVASIVAIVGLIIGIGIGYLVTGYSVPLGLECKGLLEESFAQTRKITAVVDRANNISVEANKISFVIIDSLNECIDELQICKLTNTL